MYSRAASQAMSHLQGTCRRSTLISLPRLRCVMQHRSADRQYQSTKRHHADAVKVCLQFGSLQLKIGQSLYIKIRFHLCRWLDCLVLNESKYKFYCLAAIADSRCSQEGIDCRLVYARENACNARQAEQRAAVPSKNLGVHRPGVRIEKSVGCQLQSTHPHDLLSANRQASC